jgi:hypothetical protein
LSASRTTRTSQTSGPISSSPGLMGRRNETRRAGEGGKAREPLSVATPAALLPDAGLTGLLNPTSLAQKYFNVLRPLESAEPVGAGSKCRLRVAPHRVS